MCFMSGYKSNKYRLISSKLTRLTKCYWKYFLFILLSLEDYLCEIIYNYLFYKITYFSARTWLIQCYREDLFVKIDKIHDLSYRVCSEHFAQNMFANQKHSRLKGNATPTIFPSLEGSSRCADKSSEYGHDSKLSFWSTMFDFISGLSYIVYPLRFILFRFLYLFVINN